MSVKIDSVKVSNPKRLLKVFTTLSIVSVVCILVLAGAGINRIVGNEMILAAQDTSIYVGNSIFEQEREVLLNPNQNSASVELQTKDFETLDARMKKFLRIFNMYKIKVFSKEAMIIYSTDHRTIGKSEGDNLKLTRVLAVGEVISELERKDKMLDFKGVEHLEIDVVETYVPIFDGANIIGAFEVYVDITSTQARVMNAVQGSLIVLTMILILVFGLLHLPMRKGMKGLDRAQANLHKQATTDALTGIFNRRYVFDHVQKEQARILRQKHKVATKFMAFALIDIDLFKKINDTHGHQMGDDVLQQVASRLKGCIRPYDVLGRYGGEEFLVVMPNTTLEDANFVAERLLKAVHYAPVIADGESIAVTVSIGVATTHSAVEDTDHAIKRADDCLYQAKEEGRDRVVCDQTDAAARN